jgi:hypothetical protein
MKYFKIFILLICILLGYNRSHTMPMSYYDTLAIYSDTYITDFNNDNIKDTLVSRMFSDYCNLPKYIIWGRQPGNQYTDSDNVVSSEIIYPQYKQVYSTFSLIKSNNDTLPDILFTFQGYKFDTTITTTDTIIKKVDTTDIVILFGQKKLNKYSTIRLDTITNNAKYKYYTKRVIDSVDYIKCGSSGNGYFALYQIPLFIINVDSLITNSVTKEQMEDSNASNTVIKIYPNPVNNMLYLKFLNYEKTTLMLSIFDYSSNLLFKDIVRVNKQEDIRGYSLLNYSSGKYIIVIEDQESNIIYSETIALIH